MTAATLPFIRPNDGSIWFLSFTSKPQPIQNVPAMCQQEVCTILALRIIFFSDSNAQNDLY